MHIEIFQANKNSLILGFGPSNSYDFVAGMMRFCVKLAMTAIYLIPVKVNANKELGLFKNN